MRVTFKSTRRWARLRAVVITCTLVVVGCERHRPLASADQVDLVELSPSAVTVQPNQPVDFTAVGVTGTSDTAEMAVTWSATGGSITDRGKQRGRDLGQYQNAACGSFRVAATSQSGNKSDTATVIVACPGSVASVTVNPARASVHLDETVRLTTTIRDSNGNALAGRLVTWTSSNPAVATVSGDGLVRRVTVGSATITATSEGRRGTSAITVPAPPPPGSGVIVVGVGDIAGCSSSGDEATARLVDADVGAVITLGDQAYPDGTAANYADCYDPSWGRHKARTRPTPGNHDYLTPGATGYFSYFGTNAGPPGRGYYSYDLGEWHLISLNSNVSMSAGSPQEQWLRADLAAQRKKCVLAYWHSPRFSSGSHGSSISTRPLWQALYAFDADVVVSAHDHNYQRFAPQTPSGAADPLRGIREFVVGTGGDSHYTFRTPIANTDAYDIDTYGVLKLTLYADWYTWEFIPVAGKSYTDQGSASCH